MIEPPFGDTAIGNAFSLPVAVSPLILKARKKRHVSCLLKCVMVYKTTVANLTEVAIPTAYLSGLVPQCVFLNIAITKGILYHAVVSLEKKNIYLSSQHDKLTTECVGLLIGSSSCIYKKVTFFQHPNPDRLDNIH